MQEIHHEIFSRLSNPDNDSLVLATTLALKVDEHLQKYNNINLLYNNEYIMSNFRQFLFRIK